jgi:hypothetical protein
MMDTETYVLNANVEMHRIEMCPDCVLITANGEPGGDPADFDLDRWSAGVENLWPHADGWSFGNGWSDPDAEPWFSWSPCEGCGSTLGGDREYGYVGRPASRSTSPE